MIPFPEHLPKTILSISVTFHLVFETAAQGLTLEHRDTFYQAEKIQDLFNSQDACRLRDYKKLVTFLVCLPL